MADAVYIYVKEVISEIRNTVKPPTND